MNIDFKHPNDSLTLSNGVKIPCIGFGTWRIEDDLLARQAVTTALEAGYRHIDTASIYNNEQGVGRAIRQSGLKRDQIFLTSKLWNTDQGYKSTFEAFERSMDRLQTEYLDLYLIHWPAPPQTRHIWQQSVHESWCAMEELYRAGRIRAIGVSNFWLHHMQQIMPQLEIKPMVNQLEIHPGFAQTEVVDFCHANNIVVEGWRPLAKALIFDQPQVVAMVEKYNRTPAQIFLRWAMQRGIIPLPKSVTPERIVENTHIFDFALEEQDVETLTALPPMGWSGNDPDTMQH